jgi:hypothetical protein
VGVGRIAEAVSTAAEHFGLGVEFDVNLQSDYGRDFLLLLLDHDSLLSGAEGG